MTYSELGYLRLVYEVVCHESAAKAESESAAALFASLCHRFKLDQATAEVICDALEAK